MHIPHTEWIMKTLERNGRRLLITGISLTGVVFLVTGWILSARSVFKNQLFSNIIKKQVNQEMAADKVGFLFARKETMAEIEKMVEKFPPLLQRTFISTESEGKVANGETSEFRVLQWNVLADALSTSSPTDNFIKCPPEALLWSKRKLRTLQGILMYDPDIIALEEVDHFQDFFLPSLQKLGYEGLFVAKRDSPCLKFANNSGPDGCALFYDRERFSLKNHRDVSLKDSNGEITNQVALILNLFDKIQGKTLCVAVTHLKAKEGYEDLRLSQGKSLLQSVSECVSEDKAAIVLGDFNAEPSEPVCELMEDNQYLSLKNAYVTATGRNPESTTWKIRPGKEVKHSIDYVWYSDNLNVTGCLEFPESDSIPEERCPSLHYPSDHFSLVFDFCWG
ncbi:Nocturnin [Stylophora pistillata]|uniref:Nocturnin n=3 Tax=Stylophora pistillata TaxID=50429 RepID=A0A2B4RUN8_STYPI|nr:Nocturnin [Stylophora pistillata]